MMTIALDVMGADAGPEAIVGGACQFSCEDVPARVLLVGDEVPIRQELARLEHDPSRMEVVHAPSFVAMNDKPGPALDDKADCSILRAAQLVAANDADVLVSSGNTGAVILAASRTFDRLLGVRRVGLAAVYPTIERHGPKGDPFALMLDVGATLNCSSDDLVAFAIMGCAYSSIISDIPRPRVALLSNGSEPSKGTPAIIEAHERLRSIKAIDFVGNVEGLDIPKGTADVVVCDGFVGNIVLKMLEGVSDVAKELAKKAYGKKLHWKLALGMLATGIRKVKSMTDWKQYGGAPIVGFDHLVIKAHGRSNARAIRNALKVATKTVDRDLVAHTRAGLEETFPP